MHTVTKVLIVFCAVLCLLLSALTVSYTANADRVTRAYRGLESQVAEAKANAAAEQAAAGQLRAEFEKKLLALQNEIADRETRISDLQRERSDLLVERDRAIADATAIRNRIDQLVATANSQATLIKGYRDEVSALRTEQLAANRREIDLVDRINDLESQTEVLEQTARALREQLAEAQMALQTAMASGGGAGAATAARGGVFESTGPLIRGRITQIEKTPAGFDLAVIDVGSQSGIQENMLLNIVRGGTFVGTMVITRADPRQAVGRIELVRSDAKVQPNDVVLSRLQ